MSGRNGLAALRGAILALCALAAIAGGADAQQVSRPELVEIKVGFDDNFKVNFWTPIQVTIRGGSESYTGHVELQTADSDGTLATVVSQQPYQLTPGQLTRASMFVRFGQNDPALEIRFRDEDGNVRLRRRLETMPAPDGLEIPLPLSSQQRLIISIGASIGVEDGIAYRKRTEQGRFAETISIARVSDLAQLPTAWFGYEGVDAVILSTSRPDLYGGFSDTGARSAALVEWMRLGGTVVVAAGSSAPTLLAEGGALAAFSPGRLVDSIRLTETTAMEKYAGGASPVPRPSGEFAYAVPRFETIDGVVDVSEGDVPLAIRTPRQFGQSIALAFDLDQPPFIDWKARGEFVDRLFTSAGIFPLAAPTSDDQFGMGYQDVAAELRGALDNFPGVQPVSFALVALLILVYIVLIGPGDYFFVKKILGRMELTWITFPLIVVLVSGGAYGLAYWTKGTELRLNQVDVIDVDVAAGEMRGATWLNLFSPTTQAFNLSVLPHAPNGELPAEDQVLFSWMGAPAQAWGAVGQGGAGASLFGRSYWFSPDLSAVEEAPIQVWSTKSFTSRWSAPVAPGVKGELRLGLDNVPEGTIVNQLPFALDNCLLLADRWAYTLNRLEPGKTATLKAGDQSELARTLLNRELISNDKNIVYATPYNQNQHSIEGALRLMMFYEASGGRAVHPFSDDYERFVDMSAQLKLGRAVLVGWGPQNAGDLTQGAELTNDGRPLAAPHVQHWTVYRFLLPIAARESGQ